MGSPPLLYLAPDGLHCYRQHERTTEHAGHFAPEPAGQEAFARWLGGFTAGTSFTLLVDLPDERFKIETLPHVRGPDRKRLRERRQAQIFPDTPFVAHQYLDREQSGRRDERILFAALSRPSAIVPWLDAIERNRHRLKRLVPAPFVAATVTRHLPAAPGPVLLGLLTPAGLRVSCFEGQRLLFSRLRPGSSHARPPTSQWKDEAREAHRHLLSQRLVTHSTSCTCYLLAPPMDDAASAPDTSPTQGDLHFVPQAILPLAPGTPQPSPDGEGCLPFLLHLLNSHPRLPQATPADALLSNQLSQIGLALKAAAVGILFLCWALAIVPMQEIQDLEQRRAAAKTRGDAVEHALAALVAASPAPPHPLPQLQATLDALRRRSTASTGPEPALRQLAVALSPIADIALRRIDWSANGGGADPAKDAAALGQRLILHFALPYEGARERVVHAQRILTALHNIPGARLHTQQVPVEMMATRALSPAVLKAEAQAPQLVVHLELPAATP